MKETGSKINLYSTMGADLFLNVITTVVHTFLPTFK